ncbi:MAG: DUF3050 domain-containing protein [Bacteriovoracaceae bacterium]
MHLEISNKHNDLASHPLYQSLVSLDNIRIFMKYHVFAVWDFMSLLKSLQKEITCVDVPWTASSYSAQTVRLINEIVLGEESDVDQDGKPMSHFDLYLNSMKEIGADTSLIVEFLNDFNLEKLPTELKNILNFHLSLARNGDVHEVASSFFYGREKLIPEIFHSIVNVIKLSEIDCPSLIYYLERHIEVDGEEHGPMALKCLNELIDSDRKQQEVVDIAVQSLDMRWRLWDFIYSEMDKS